IAMSRENPGNCHENCEQGYQGDHTEQKERVEIEIEKIKHQATEHQAYSACSPFLIAAMKRYTSPSVLISRTFSSVRIFTPKLLWRATIKSTISRLSSPRSVKIWASGTSRSGSISKESSNTLLVISVISCSVITPPS